MKDEMKSGSKEEMTKTIKRKIVRGEEGKGAINNTHERKRKRR